MPKLPPYRNHIATLAFNQLIIAKTLFLQWLSLKYVMEAVAIVTVSKLLMSQIENFVLLIDFGDVDRTEK